VFEVTQEGLNGLLEISMRKKNDKTDLSNEKGERKEDEDVDVQRTRESGWPDFKRPS
jgi:hypothetical protein